MLQVCSIESMCFNYVPIESMCNGEDMFIFVGKSSRIKQLFYCNNMADGTTTVHNILLG